jgi:hypothetical protein
MSDVAEGGVRPARGYSWEPFQPGHELSLRHGAWSQRHVQPVATEILQSVLDDPACEYLKVPRFAAELEAWAVAEARCRLLESYIAKLAEGDDTGVGDLADETTRAAWALLHRCETRAQSGRDRLGLSPAAAGKLGRDLAVARSSQDLDRLKTLGQVLLDAAQDAEETTAGDGGEVDGGDSN